MTGARRTVGRYEIDREIGRGGMASVYLARQLDLERKVALKELRELSTSDPSVAQRFLREARLAGSLSHPNIVTVHDYFEHDRVPYIAMEYLARGSLRPYIGYLTLAQVGAVLAGLLAGLAHAEGHGVVHRDIKPENLLVTLEGGIKIADFGIAKATSALESRSRSMLTATGTTVGTPNYIAPEQAMAGELGPWTDLYSVGITAFELFVGRTPFGDTEQPMAIVLRHINEPVPRVGDLVPNVDPWISDWIGWLVSKAPADRPQTAGQAWDALEEGLLGLLGPRWSRQAALLAPEAQPAAVRDARPLPRGVGLGAAAAVGVGPQSSPVPSPMAPTGALGATARWSQRTMRPDSDPRLAATVAPRLPAADAQPTARTTWPRRIPTVLKVAAAAVILFAAGATALSATAGGRPPTAGQQSDQAQVGSPSTSAPASPGLNTAPTATASAAPPTTSSGGASASLAGQVAPARQLARTYDRAAKQISGQSAGGSPSGADALVVSALRQTASAYRAAAAAAAADDLAGYTAAVTAAETGRTKVSALLNRSLQGGSSSAPPAPVQSPRSSCAGDSDSDDPSDDSCSGGA